MEIFIIVILVVLIGFYSVAYVNKTNQLKNHILETETKLKNAVSEIEKLNEKIKILISEKFQVCSKTEVLTDKEKSEISNISLNETIETVQTSETVQAPEKSEKTKIPKVKKTIKSSDIKTSPKTPIKTKRSK